MTNSKSTKRALVFSALAILMCAAMLIGTTFAWFTDTASTAVNKIQAGNLKVDIVDMAGNSLEGKALSWVKANGAAEEEVLWEPGCTYYLTPFMIQNQGNLALKYKVAISGVNGDAKLLDALDFGFYYFSPGFGNMRSLDELIEGGKLDNVLEYPGLCTAPIYIVAHMKEDAGNEYQGLSIDGIGITVVATQDTYESDSFDDQYDKDAKYPATVSDIKATYGVDGLSMPDGVKIEKAADGVNGHFDITLEDEEAFLYFTQVFDRRAALDARTEALNNGTATKYEGESVHNPLNIWYYENAVTLKMGCDIDLHGATVNPFSFGGIYFDGQGHTIKNAKLTATSGNVGFFAGGVTPSNVVFDNIQVSATGCDSAGVVFGSTNTNITNVTVKNCSVIGGKYTGAVVGYNYGSIVDCAVADTVVSGQYKVGGIIGFICSEKTTEHREVSSNELTNVTVKGENLLTDKSAFVIGKVVGHWNNVAGSGTCRDNTFSGTTTATDNIGLTSGTVTEG